MTTEMQLLPIADVHVRPPRPALAAKQWLMLLGLLLCWSSSFIGIRFTVDYAPIALVAFWRNLIAGLLLLPFALLIGPRPRLRDILIQAIFGIFAMGGLILGCGIAIEEGVPTGIVALMSDMLPLAIVLLSIPIFGQIVTRGEWVGIGLAICGVLVASAGSLHVGAAPKWAYALPFLGMISIAVVTLLQQRWSSSFLPIHQSVAIQSLASSLVFLVVTTAQGRIAPPLAPNFWIGIAWLVMFATIGAYGLYYLCLRHHSSTIVSSTLYLSPPATMIWGSIMFSESLSTVMGLGVFITMIGVIIASKHHVKRTH